jgi:hypothetical protein
MLDNVDYGLEMQLGVKSYPDYVDSPPFFSQQNEHGRRQFHPGIFINS